MKTTPVSQIISGLHDIPVELRRNNFINKSLSSFACNLFVGCGHGCRFCYVADTTTGRTRQRSVLAAYGVADPFSQWGDYVLVRPFDERQFRRDLEKAQNTPLGELNPDGNRAVIFCSTTDPYMVVRNRDAETGRQLNLLARDSMRRSLELILDHSDLNVRILTRSPLAREDFDLMKRFGNRLMLGVSLPTLDAKLSKVYEGRSPAPKQRLRLLQDARDTGIPIFVAVAPVFPEVDRAGLLEVFKEVSKLNPLTVFMEPVNRRKGIVDRIRDAGMKHGIRVTPEIFEEIKLWAPYAIKALKDAEEVAIETELANRLHLWPDADLKSQSVLETLSNPADHIRWLDKWWHRISEWPGKTTSPWADEIK